MLFFKKKPVENVQNTLDDEIRSLKMRFTKIEAEILGLATAQDILRDKVLRKIQVKRTSEEEEDDTWNGIPINK